MKLMVRFAALLLLLINGIGAIYGGCNLIRYPDGSSLHFRAGYLKYSPFENYAIPGIILLVTNGLFSFWVIESIILKRRNHESLITYRAFC